MRPRRATLPIGTLVRASPPALGRPTGPTLEEMPMLDETTRAILPPSAYAGLDSIILTG